MSITPKDQFEDLLIERSELKREVEKYKMERVLIDSETTRLKAKVSQLGQRADKAESESAEARGNVEKALRELSEEVAKRHKAEAELEAANKACAEMRRAIKESLECPLNHTLYQSCSCEKDLEHALSTDCGKDYHHISETVPKMEAYADTMVEECNRKWREKTKQLVETLKLHHEWSAYQSKNNQIVYSAALRADTEKALAATEEAQ